MVQGTSKKSKSNGRPGAAQKSKNAAKYKKAIVNDMRAKVGSSTKMPKRGNFKDEAITDKALSKVQFASNALVHVTCRFLCFFPFLSSRQ